MSSPADPEGRLPGDAERVRALRALKLLDTPPEERFDRLTRALTEELELPIAYVSLVDAERQWLKSRQGEIETEIPRDESFCNVTIQQDGPTVVPDATLDPRFADKRLVTGEAGIRSYAGTPIHDPSGQRIGTVCVAGRQPRSFSPDEVATLERYARKVQEEINAKPSIFVSYAHEDEQWKDRLLAQCSILQRQGLIELWSDREIGVGEDWNARILRAIERAKVAIVLVSADFLASDFIQEEEIPRLLARRDREGLKILPVVVKPCPWQTVDWLAAMNLWPPDGRPITGGSDFEADTALAELAARIAEMILEKGGALTTKELSAVIAQTQVAIPIDRFATASEAAANAEPAAAAGVGGSAGAAPTPPAAAAAPREPAAAGRSSPRRRWLLVAALVAVLAVLGGAFAFWKGRSAEKSFDLAVERLGSDSPQLRMDAMATLGRLAGESERLKRRSAQRLADFILLRAPLESDLEAADRTQIQKAVQVLGGLGVRGVVLASTDLTGLALENARLPEADLSGANLVSAVLSGADLTGADLSAAALQRASLDRARLAGANLTGANLRESYLREAVLAGAGLESASLAGADLQLADLGGSLLIGARLSDADLRGARLAGADLREAILDRARLGGADLESVNNLAQDQLDRACVDDGTLLPLGLAPPPPC